MTLDEDGAERLRRWMLVWTSELHNWLLGWNPKNGLLMRLDLFLGMQVLRFRFFIKCVGTPVNRQLGTFKEWNPFDPKRRN